MNRLRFLSLTLLLPTLMVVGCGGSAASETGFLVNRVLELLSINDAGDDGAGSDAEAPSSSSTGQYVAFESDASDLISGGNGTRDVYVRNRFNSKTEQVSVDSNGTPGDDASSGASISPNGRHVVFQSDATNLTPTVGVASTTQIYLHDRSSGDTVLVSHDPGGGFGDAASREAFFCGSRYVVFTSDSEDLVVDDDNGVADVFRYDRNNGNVIRVSLTHAGAQADAASGQPSCSGSGNLIGFVTAADMDSGTNGFDQVYLRNVNQASTLLVSHGAADALGDADSGEPAVSGLGGSILFASEASNLDTASNENCSSAPCADIFSYNVSTGVVSPIGDYSQDNRSPTVSEDGFYVAWRSSNPVLTGSAWDGDYQIAMINRNNLTVKVLSRERNGTSVDSDAGPPSISRNSRYIAFDAEHPYPRTVDTNGNRDVFAVPRP